MEHPATAALTVASYARTSTDHQNSCRAQRDACRRLVNERDWRLAFHLQDEGERGRSGNRPGYRRLIDLAEDGRIGAIIVWKLDRLFRSLKEASAAEERLRNANVAIVSVTEPFDTTTAIGRFVFGFLANVAQFETELIRERALLGYERRTREGKWTGSRPPFGYVKDDSGALLVAKDEAFTVQTMHRMYRRCGGDRALAAWLNSRGISRRNAPWTTDQVRKALTSPTTTGNLTVRGSSAFHKHLQIVSAQTFARTQEARAAVQARGRGPTPSDKECRLDLILGDYLSSLSDSSTTA